MSSFSHYDPFSSEITHATELERDDEVLGHMSGFERFNNKRYNKGQAFTREERKMLGLHGLLPYAIRTIQKQIEDCLQILRNCSTPLDKYMFLRRMAECNQRLYHKLLRDYIQELLPIIFVPTLAYVCLKYNFVQSFCPRGMFITIRDKDNIMDVLKNWPETDIKIVVCSNGGRVLSLGDLGANGMASVIARSDLYTTMGSLKPYQILPICLDVGSDNYRLLDYEHYIGLRQNRCLESVFHEFMDEFVYSVAKRFGPDCIMHFEDFEFENGFKMLEKYRNKYCMFNGDIQSTPAAVLAGLYTTTRLTNILLKDHKILVLGTGQVPIGIANIIAQAMEKQEIEIEEARENIWLFDNFGLVCAERSKCQLNNFILPYAHCAESTNSLNDAIMQIKPSVLIGASAMPGAFTKCVIEKMAQINEKPIIIVTSTPNDFSECTAQQAIQWSNGNALFASGAPFPQTEFDGRVYETSQCNNFYIYPGLALGVLCSGIKNITDDMFIAIAEKLSKLLSYDQLQRGMLYPPIDKMQTVTLAVAETIMHMAYRKCLATNPKPKDKIQYMKSQQYNFEYPPVYPH